MNENLITLLIVAIFGACLLTSCDSKPASENPAPLMTEPYEEQSPEAVDVQPPKAAAEEVTEEVRVESTTDIESTNIGEEAAICVEEIASIKLQIAQERKNAVGQDIGSLTLPSGRTYEQATIREVTDVGISISHAEGAARIRAEDLPEALRDRFSFDSEKARQLIENELRLAQLNEQVLGDAPPTLASGADPVTSDQLQPAPPATTPEIPAVPQGRLDARVVGSQRGSKEVEFVCIANVDVTLTVYQTVRNPPNYIVTFRIPANARTIHRVLVRNQYRATLTDSNRRVLDEATHAGKTGLGRTGLGD